MQCSGYDCQKRRILDWNSGRRSRLQSWPTQKHLEIALIVWHQMVEIEYFYERLETPRPPRKVTLSKNWQCQQQHSTSGTDLPSLWEQGQKSEDLPEVQDGSKHVLEDQATGSSLFLQWMRFTLMMSTSLRVHVQVETRIIKLLNELKLVQRKFEFAKIWWMKALNSVKSPLKPPKTWPTLSSSNQGLLKFINVPHEDTPY